MLLNFSRYKKSKLNFFYYYTKNWIHYKGIYVLPITFIMPSPGVIRHRLTCRMDGATLLTILVKI